MHLAKAYVVIMLALAVLYFETDNCTGTSLSNTLAATTATSISTRRTTTATTERTTSATQSRTDLSGLPESTSSGSETTQGKKNETGDKVDRITVMGLAVSLVAFILVTLIKLALDRTTIIVLAVSLAAVFLITLAVILFLKRKKRRAQDIEILRPNETTWNPLEDRYQAVLNPKTAATQLGLSKTEDGIGSNKRESPQREAPTNRECEYHTLNPLTMIPEEKFYASLEKDEGEISDSGSWDESPTYVNQMPVAEYVNVPL